MSLIVDNKNICLEVKKLNNYIKEYNDNVYDIFFELSKLNSYWKDKNSAVFEEKINIEKMNNQIILDNLQKISDFYKEIDNIYNINNTSKLEFNIQNKNGVINQMNNCIDELCNINNIAYNTILPYDFYYKSAFIDLKNDINKTKDNLANYKTDFTMITNEINKNELELSSTINKIEEIIIEKFE